MTAEGITPYVTTSGQRRYRARVQSSPHPETGRRRWDSKTFATEKAAKLWRAQQLADPAAVAARTPLAEFLTERWLPHYAATFRPSSYRTRRSHVRAHLVPMLGSVTLNKLTTSAIERAFAARRTAGKLTIAQSHRVLTTLTTALNQAVRWELLPRNPTRAVQLPAMPRRQRKPLWTADQLETFLRDQDPPWSILWALLAGTGMRIGEGLALRWDDMVWEPVPLVRVRWTVARGTEGEYETAPKSEAGNRDVVIGAGLVQRLQTWRAQQAAWPEHAVYVIAREDQQRIPIQTAYDHWNAALAASGLPHLTPHGLRHLATSEQLAAGVPLKVVSARIGHSSIALTADLYGHILAEHQGDAAAVLDRLIGGSSSREPGNPK